MKKVIGLFVIVFLVLGVTVFAEELSLDKKVEDFVKDVATTKGVDKEKITGVKQVDFNDLPKEVNIQNIDETNLALYEINVLDEKPVYVVTASSQLFTETIKKYAQRMLLTFGLSGEISNSVYMKTAAGVITDLEKGYVMTRDGTITGISTNIEITERLNSNPIEIIIYKDGEEVGFRNSFNSDKTGIYSDYDTVSSGTIKFNKGDLISIKVNVPAGTKVKDITTLLEIETE
ncbi:hypothetical protein GW932_00060 [archaeon]|nr:hypothetical protein [archaeon]